MNNKKNNPLLLQEVKRVRINDQLEQINPVLKDEVNLIFEDMLDKLRQHQAELADQNEKLRQTQTVLETTKAHYVDLYDNAPVGYLTVDAEGTIREINATALELIGENRRRVINRPFADFVSNDYKAVWERHFQNARLSSGKEGCELPFTYRNGKTVYLHINCRYLQLDPSYEFIRITLTDVTARKYAEENLRIAAAAFEAQEGIVVTDADKVILRVNKAFSQLTGFSPADVIGKNLKLLCAEFQNDAYYETMFNIVGEKGYWQGELLGQRQNGSLFPVLQTITSITDDDKQQTHYVGTLVDITLQKHAEQVLREARNKLERQVAHSQEELDKIKRETSEVNTALNVLLRQRVTDKSDAQLALSGEVETTVLPLLNKLKKASHGRHQSTRLINILEENLRQLVESYGRTHHLAAIYQKLTPLETQVASMIRQGQQTKVIAAALNIAPGTVSIHRKHIRKKLGLHGKKDNLYSYLHSLLE